MSDNMCGYCKYLVNGYGDCTKYTIELELGGSANRSLKKGPDIHTWFSCEECLSDERTETHLSDANYDKQTIAQLYKSIALLSKHIVEDNSKCNDVYPIGVRTIQLVTLKALIREVETHH